MTKWSHFVPFLPLIGCAWPTTVGLRNDALLPPAGKVEVVGIAGAGVPAEGDEWSSVLPGAQVTVGVTDRWAVSLAAALPDPNSAVLYTELEARWRVLGDSPDAFGLVLLGGASRFVGWPPHWAPFQGQLGLDLGAVAGRSFGVMRPYSGLKLNLVPVRESDLVCDDGIMAWLLPAVGVTARPALGERLGLVIGAEAFAALYLDDPSYGPGYGALGWVGVGPRLTP